MVKEIHGLAEYQNETRGPGLVVVDFFATWCGPCRQIAPFIENLSRKYPDVKFLKVDVDENQDIASANRVSAMPTFHFILKGNLVEEMKGANPSSLEEKVIKHRASAPVASFAGSGNVLSSAPANIENPENARAARLKAFAEMEGVRKKPEAPVPASVVDNDEEQALQQALALSMAAASHGSGSSSVTKPVEKAAEEDSAEFVAAAAEFDAAAAEIKHFQQAPDQKWEEEMVPVPVNEELLSQLIDMGFGDTISRKSLVHGGTLEGAMNWITEHQDDPDIDQPYMVRKIDTLPKPPLSEEEKAARQKAIRDKIVQRKAERAKQEKQDEIKREKERRERGQVLEQTMEERQRLQRKRDAERMKREKDDQAKERERLRAEIARDKEVRKLNKGVLPSVLGVDGYNPSIIQYGVPDGGSSAPVTGNPSSTTSSTPSPAAPPVKAAVAAAPKPAAVPAPVKKASVASAAAPVSTLSADQRVDSAIQTLLRYRTAGDGGAALKLLITFVRNVVDNPEEPKYRSISLESNAFKTKLAPLVGPLSLLKAVGFQKGEGEDEFKLKLDSDADSALLSQTLKKLVDAEALYRQQNAF